MTWRRVDSYAAPAAWSTRRPATREKRERFGPVGLLEQVTARKRNW